MGLFYSTPVSQEHPQAIIQENQNINEVDDIPQRTSKYYTLNPLGKKMFICGKSGVGKTKLIKYIHHLVHNKISTTNTYVVDPCNSMTKEYNSDFFKVIKNLDDINFNDNKEKLFIFDHFNKLHDSKNENFEKMMCDKYSTVIVSLQFPLGISPQLRSLFNVVFLGRDDFFTNRKRLYDNYCGFYKTFKKFNDHLDQCGDYSFFTVVSTPFNRNVYSFKLDESHLY
jgi:energy-coupling factor transporter ATP-binding protein EcfA2